MFLVFAVLVISGAFSRQEAVHGSLIWGASNSKNPSSSWSWEFSLNFDRRHVCQASLINDRWAVTAEQCISGRTDPSRYFLVAGTNHSTGSQGEGHTSPIGVKRIVVRTKILPRNVALLELKFPLPHTSRTTFVSLPEYGSRVQSGARCHVSDAQHSRVYVVPDNICALINGPEVHEPSMMCVRGSRSGIENMALGGHLTCREKGRLVLRGLSGPSRRVASASSQSRVQRYSVYIRVSTHVDRISDVIAPYPPPGFMCWDRDANCRYFRRYCAWHSYVRRDCKRTCNLC